MVEKNSQDINFKEILPISKKIGYSFVNMGSNLLSLIVFTSITFFYNVKFGLGKEYIAFAWLIFGIWNAINDPIFGILEEKTKTKIGRRIPYIRYGAPIYIAAFIFCWYPFVDINNQVLVCLNLILSLAIFDTIFTIIGLVAYSLPAEMTFTAKARTNLILYSTIIGGIGTIIGNFIMASLLLNSESSALDPYFRPAMIIIGVVCGVLMFISSYYLKENEYTQREETLSIVASVIETFKNKAFVIFEAAAILFIILQTLLGSGLLYYIKFVLGLSGTAAGFPSLVLYLTMLLFSVIVNALVPKFGLKKILLYGAMWGAGSFLLLFLIGQTIEGGYIGIIFLSFGLAAITLSSQAIFADIVDYDEFKTGKRRETTYSGVQALVTKPSISIGNALLMLILGSYGFDENIAVQSESAILGIMIAVFLVPAIISIICVVIARFYPLYGSKWQETKLNLAKIHQEKERAYLETKSN